MRWFRFSLRTLLLAVTLVAIVLSWILWQHGLAQQRQEFLEMIEAKGGEFAILSQPLQSTRLTFLWLKSSPAGQYWYCQYLDRVDDKILANRPGPYREWLNDRTIGAIKLPKDLPADVREAAMSLFPEATIE